MSPRLSILIAGFAAALIAPAASAVTPVPEPPNHPAVAAKRGTLMVSPQPTPPGKAAQRNDSVAAGPQPEPPRLRRRHPR
jgi:hypothetical protein